MHFLTSLFLSAEIATEMFPVGNFDIIQMTERKLLGFFFESHHVALGLYHRVTRHY